MLYSKYEDFLSFSKGKRILITTHDLVDIDGLASCYALKYFLNEYYNTPFISVLFSELRKSTKNFMVRFTKKFPKFKFKFDNRVDFTKFDLCIIIDTNDIQQLRYSDKKEFLLDLPYIIVDHHYTDEEKLKIDRNNLFNLLNDNISSSAEIILDLYDYFKQILPLPYKYLLSAAILTDSGFFRHGNNTTIKNLSNLLDEEVSFQEMTMMLQNQSDISEKIAKIKGLQRVKLIREGDYLIGISRVSSFKAKIASTLIKIGFDISLVYSKDKNKNIINSRASKDVISRTGLHLGRIFEETSQKFEGSGGGHDGAASITFKADFETILLDIREKIKQFLTSKF